MKKQARPTFAGRGTRDGTESRHEGDHNMILHRRHFLLTPSLYHRASGRYVLKHPAQIMARATNVTVNTTLTRERPQWDPQGRKINTNDEMYLICLALPVHVFSHIESIDGQARSTLGRNALIPTSLWMIPPFKRHS